MSKRLLGPGLRQVYKVSPQLSAVLGVGQTSRQDALKGVWAYIKTKNLQNPLAKREIIADDTLAAVFGKKKVTMFEVMKFMNPHFQGKV